MFVSKKKYDALEAQMGEIAQYWIREYNKLHNELDDLKASRARSNENLKLGTAASAKARRKVKGVDWAKPIEAIHEDGRVVSGTVSFGPDEDGDREFGKSLDGGRRLFHEDGSPWSESGWRIRNV